MTPSSASATSTATASPDLLAARAGYRHAVVAPGEDIRRLRPRMWVADGFGRFASAHRLIRAAGSRWPAHSGSERATVLRPGAATSTSEPVPATSARKSACPSADHGSRSVSTRRSSARTGRRRSVAVERGEHVALPRPQHAVVEHPGGSGSANGVANGRSAQASVTARSGGGAHVPGSTTARPPPPAPRRPRARRSTRRRGTPVRASAAAASSGSGRPGSSISSSAYRFAVLRDPVGDRSSPTARCARRSCRRRR